MTDEKAATSVDAQVAEIDRKKAERMETMRKNLRKAAEDERRETAKEKARPSKPRPVPTAEELRNAAPREPDPEPETPDLPPDSDLLLRIIARLDEEQLRRDWQTKNDTRLGAADKVWARKSAEGIRAAIDIIRGEFLDG